MIPHTFRRIALAHDLLPAADAPPPEPIRAAPSVPDTGREPIDRTVLVRPGTDRAD